MSGFVGIFNLDGTPVDREVLEQMTQYLIPRGPDNYHTWTNSQIGFGHALLITTNESKNEPQPCSIDNKLWITGNVRIDARETLIKKLASNGCTDIHSSPDSFLILHAWRLWGENMMSELIGDFSFALWDDTKQLLFCARDQLGIKPFYYINKNNTFIFSNTLNCLQLHPLFNKKLNDFAIVDYLVFGINTNTSSTSFLDIKQIPPAHTLGVSKERVNCNRYWSLPVESMIRYRSSSEYVEHFNTLFTEAVNDRLRYDNIGVLMSGGMDSTSIATVTSECITSQAYDSNFQTHFFDIGDLLPIAEEHEYASLVAKKLNVPLNIQSMDNSNLFQHYTGNGWRAPEPLMQPFYSAYLKLLTSINQHSRVLLTGHGGDPLFASAPFYLKHCIKNGDWSYFINDSWKYIRCFNRIPPLGLRTWIKKRFEMKPAQPKLPPWLHPHIIKQMDLDKRWDEWLQRYIPGKTHIHPTRPEAYESITSSYWPFVFNFFDSQVSGLPIEVRHPLFDIRLLQFMLRVPPVPWCNDKQLLRQAMKNRLPEPVLKLAKIRSTVPASYSAILRQDKAVWGSLIQQVQGLADYIDYDSYHRMASHRDQMTKFSDSVLITHPLEVILWMKQYDF